MSKRPSARPCIWKVELGVGVSTTRTPLASNKPCRSAAQVGRLKPPGKTMTSSFCGALGCAMALETTNDARINSNLISGSQRGNAGVADLLILVRLHAGNAHRADAVAVVHDRHPALHRQDRHLDQRRARGD